MKKDLKKEKFLHMAFHLKNRKETLKRPESSVVEFFNVTRTAAKKNLNTLVEKVEE
jgi:hypothetical protein